MQPAEEKVIVKLSRIFVMTDGKEFENSMFSETDAQKIGYKNRASLAASLSGQAAKNKNVCFIGPRQGSQPRRFGWTDEFKQMMVERGFYTSTNAQAAQTETEDAAEERAEESAQSRTEVHEQFRCRPKTFLKMKRLYELVSGSGFSIHDLDDQDAQMLGYKDKNSLFSCLIKQEKKGSFVKKKQVDPVTKANLYEWTDEFIDLMEGVEQSAVQEAEEPEAPEEESEPEDVAQEPEQEIEQSIDEVLEDPDSLESDLSTDDLDELNRLLGGENFRIENLEKHRDELTRQYNGLVIQATQLEQDLIRKREAISRGERLLDEQKAELEKRYRRRLEIKSRIRVLELESELDPILADKPASEVRELLARLIEKYKE